MTAPKPIPGRVPEKDIIETRGPYDFVAKEVQGEHRARVWTKEKGLPRRVLLEGGGTSNADAMDKLKVAFDAMQDARAVDSPSDEQIAAGWRAIWDYLNEAQIKQVWALYQAPQRRRSVLELAEVAGYKDHRGVSRWLGEVALLMYGQAPRKRLPTEFQPDGITPVYTYTLCSGVGKALNSDDEAWVWELRPEVARGLELAGMVPKGAT